MRHAIALALLLAPGLAAAEAKYDKSATHDCGKDPTVFINNGKGTYKITGACTKVTVNGAMNVVSLEGVKQLVLSGASNTVTVGTLDEVDLVGAANTLTYKKTSAGGALKKTGSGVGNKVTQEK
jgi:hypothetical protein